MSYFMQYQIDWLKDNSKIKLWEKSRQIGATYTQSYEDVCDCIAMRVPAVWFSSADLTASLEYIKYCENWARIFNIVVRNVGEIAIDDKGMKAFTLEFANGTEIHALSSSPTNFRSKKGKIVLDEFAFHENADELWKAAFPVSTWGFPIRILSTHNGKTCKYYRFIEEINNGSLPWSHHKVDIYDAVKCGLADKVSGRQLTDEERQEWIAEQRKLCGDDTAWKQEYECVPVDEATAFLTYEEIAAAESEDILTSIADIQNDFFVGMDIARRKHLSVIWGMEKVGSQVITRFYRELQDMKFEQQREILFSVLSHRRMRRAAIDATGLGMQLAEEAQSKFGKMRVEAITFTPKSKEELAFGIKRRFDDNSISIPKNFEIREDFHSVRKIIGLSGNIRFDVNQSNTDGHADRFWAAALCCYAVGNDKGAINISTGNRRKSSSIARGYDNE